LHWQQPDHAGTDGKGLSHQDGKLSIATGITGEGISGTMAMTGSSTHCFAKRSRQGFPCDAKIALPFAENPGILTFDNGFVSLRTIMKFARSSILNLLSSAKLMDAKLRSVVILIISSKTFCAEKMMPSACR
jgi:hypothetical protein